MATGRAALCSRLTWFRSTWFPSTWFRSTWFPSTWFPSTGFDHWCNSEITAPVLLYGLRNGFPPHRHVQLSRGGQVRSHQVDVRHFRRAVVLLRVQVIHQRRLPALVGKRYRVA